MSTALDKAFQRLMDRFPPKHPDRTKVRAYEQRVNDTPHVITNGWQQRRTGTTVDWSKQDRIPVGNPNPQPSGPSPRGFVSAGKGRGNKGPKNSG